MSDPSQHGGTTVGGGSWNPPQQVAPPSGQLPETPPEQAPEGPDTPERRNRLLLAAHMLVRRWRQGRNRPPNILAIWGDDIGFWNPSCYNLGMMGYRTPNIDRIANEGALFTDCYGEQSCTAGRSAFITGQCPLRTGLTKVGLPGAPEGLSEKDPTLAELLKPLGYVCGQFGKNHLGDRNEHLPTVHGFDEFLGNLYHLNAQDEPQHPDYPKDPKFFATFGPRGVLHCLATERDDNTVDPRFGRVGKQTIRDTGPLTMERMETIDDEITEAALKFMRQSNRDRKPFFCWWNSSRMHVWTRLKKESRGKTGLGTYPDGMVEHDAHVGQLLDFLDKEKLTEDTIVIYTTDNGAEVFTWPDGGQTPFRGEKGTTWEGGLRVPALMRWPGVIKPGTKINDIFSHQDWLPTLMAAAGVEDIKQKLLAGHTVEGDRRRDRMTYNVHLDGYDQTACLSGEGPGPRNEFFYFTDDGEIAAMRYLQYKLHFMEQEHGGIKGWMKPFIRLATPYIMNLRSDPFEDAEHEAGSWDTWFMEHAFVIVPAMAIVSQFAQSFKDYPPRFRPGSFVPGADGGSTFAVDVARPSPADRLIENARETLEHMRLTD